MRPFSVRLSEKGYVAMAPQAKARYPNLGETAAVRRYVQDLITEAAVAHDAANSEHAVYAAAYDAVHK